MRRNPLVLFLGAAIVAILAVLGFTYPKWAPTSLTQEVSAPAAETAAATPETPAEPAAAETAPAAEAAATEPVKPTFDVVRVEPDGSAVIAGRASPAADVVVTLSGNELGAAKATENGEWVVVTTTPIAPGSYELKAVAKVGDTQVVSDQSVALVVPAAGTDEKVLAVVSEPNKPSQVLSQEAPLPLQRLRLNRLLLKPLPLNRLRLNRLRLNRLLLRLPLPKWCLQARFQSIRLIIMRQAT